MGEPSNIPLNIKDIDTPDPLPISYRVIYDALLDLFPDSALTILYSLKKIVVFDKDVPGFSTIGVSKNFTLFIYKPFWDKYMHNEDALKTVLMHELMHCVGGDIFQLLGPDDKDLNPEWELINQANNIAMDTRINAYICNARPDINPQDFLEEFYGEASVKNWMAGLLKPGTKFDTTNADQASVAPYYKKFYNTEEFCSHHELYEKVYDILKKTQSQGKTLTIKLIGAHGQGGKELTPEDLEGVTKIEIDTSELDDMPENDEKQSIDTTGGEDDNPLKKAVMDALAEQAARKAGRGSKSADFFIDVSQDIKEKLNLQRFKKLMFDNIFHNVRSQARRRTGSYATTPIIPKHIATSDLLMAAMDYPVMLWKTKRWSYSIDNNLLPIYLDVSGSTRPYLKEIIKLITNVSNELEYVWGFSNVIEKHTMDELKQGRTKGTGGTDFDCVINHAEENNFKHIVVITDGEAWSSRQQKPENLKSVVTILFGYACKDNYFSINYGNTHMIDEVKI